MSEQTIETIKRELQALEYDIKAVRKLLEGAESSQWQAIDENLAKTKELYMLVRGDIIAKANALTSV